MPVEPSAMRVTRPARGDPRIPPITPGAPTSLASRATSRLTPHPRRRAHPRPNLPPLPAPRRARWQPDRPRVEAQKRSQRVTRDGRSVMRVTKAGLAGQRVQRITRDAPMRHAWRATDSPRRCLTRLQPLAGLRGVVFWHAHLTNSTHPI